MFIEQVIVSLVVLLLIMLLAEPLSRWTRLPFVSVLVTIGFILSEILVRSGIDTGIRAQNFQFLIFYVFIPVLVFEAAYRINIKLLGKNIVPILFLSIIGMLLTALITAAGLYYGIAHTTGFPWIAALLTGTIIAATDPVSVVVRLKALGKHKRLVILLEGESLFNDASAIVMFGLFLSMATTMNSNVSISTVFYDFSYVFFGGFVVGALIGGIASLVVKKIKKIILTSVVSIATAYGSYITAELIFHVSGIMSTLIAGIILATCMQKKTNEVIQNNNKVIWELISYIANSIVFILMGVVITINMFEERWLAMLIAIAAVLVARMVSIYGGLSLLSIFQKQPVPAQYQTVMIWGGLRGSVTLALALSIPTTLPYWWTIQSVAFGVVVFTLFLQAPTAPLIIDRLKNIDK